MTYQAPKAAARFEQEIKKSRFIGIAMPIGSLAEVERHLEAIEKELPGATHTCWAAIVGNPDAGATFRFHDAGEPAGTAGRPILGALRHKAVGDALVVVVRYFGGVKLGAGGLARAYSGTASRVLDAVELETVTARADFRLEIDFADEPAARRLLNQLGIEILSFEYGGAVCFRFRASEEESEAVARELGERTSGRARVHRC